MLSAMEEGTKRRTTTTTRTENPKRQVDTASEKRLSENGVSSRILDQRGVGLRWSASRRMMIAILSLLVAGLMVILSIRIQLLSRIAVLRGVTLLPVACCTFSAFQQWRRRQYYCAIIPAAAVLTVVAAQLPSFLAVGIAAGSIVAFGLATRPVEDNAPRHVATSKATTRSQSMADSTVSSMAVIQGVLVVIAVLLSENFLIWVVSATFEAGQHITTEPPPLQDNGQRVLKYILSTLTKPQVIGLRRLLNTQWSLVACLGASFAYVELHRYGRTGPLTTTTKVAHRTLFGVATRMAYTVAIARFVRTASFLLTVLPSQVRNCYAQRFPVPPPTDWVDWVWVGLIPRSHGGCNDLIISGHAVITSSSTCLLIGAASRFDRPEYSNLTPSLLFVQWRASLHLSPTTLSFPWHCGPWSSWITPWKYMKATTTRSTCGWVLCLFRCYGESCNRSKVLRRRRHPCRTGTLSWQVQSSPTVRQRLQRPIFLIPRATLLLHPSLWSLMCFPLLWPIFSSFSCPNGRPTF
jgi:hypothetical protein